MFTASKPTSLRTEFCESQRSQLSSQQPGRLQRMLKPPQFILLPLASALLSTVHCLYHMQQASKLHSPICSHNSTVATSCAHSARRVLSLQCPCRLSAQLKPLPGQRALS